MNIKLLTASLPLLLAFNGCMNTGCTGKMISSEFAGTIQQTVVALEREGVDYRLEGYLPTRTFALWSPFHFGMEAPGGYVKAFVSRGRGLGTRAPDTDLSYVLPPSDGADILPPGNGAYILPPGNGADSVALETESDN